MYPGRRCESKRPGRPLRTCAPRGRARHVRVHGCEKYAVPREEIADERWGDPRGRYMFNLHSPISVAVAAPYARGLSRPRARRDHTINAFQYHEASDTSALTQTVPRRRAAPVRGGGARKP